MGNMLNVPHPAHTRFHQLHSESTALCQRELIEGLAAETPRIDPKFFYDTLGSILFDAITKTPEYYPTRAEAEIFERHGTEIARHVGPIGAMIDLGAANCRKAESLFPVLNPSQYVPIDISVDYLRTAVARLERVYPDIPILALGMDFSDRLELPNEVMVENRLFFYPGSSVGNLSPDEALALLCGLHSASANNGGILIGVDRVKDADVLVNAYADALGITGAFNLNVLRHVNAIIGSDFDLSDWRHVALFDAARSRIEMHLEAVRATTVTIATKTRQFDAGERILTECSYKYTPEAFTTLLQKSGFTSVSHWTDSSDLFSVFSARA